MAFRIHDGAGFEDFDEPATYTFNEAGLLVVHLGPGGRRLTYSPQAWTVVEEPDDRGGYRERDESHLKGPIAR